MQTGNGFAAKRAAASSIPKRDGGPNVDIDLIFKIAAIGIIVAILNQVLNKAERQEQAMMVTLAGLIVVLGMIVGMVIVYG